MRSLIGEVIAWRRYLLGWGMEDWYMEAETLSYCKSFTILSITVLGSYDIEAVRYGMSSMMPLTDFLNASVASIGVLVGTGAGVLLGTVEGKSRVLFGYRLEGSDTVYLKYEGGYRLGEAVLPAVRPGKRGGVRRECWFLLEGHGRLRQIKLGR